jgi:molybdopterin-guanine dinucleotide biosynthesis protein A
MGRDKAFLEVQGLPMIEQVIRALRTLVSRIIIVTNTPDAYARYGAETVPDALDKRGSLVGLYSGLLRSQDELNIVVACDMPFLNPRLLGYMAGLAGEYDVVLPKIDSFVEPLHAIYRRNLLPVIEDHIRRDQRRIQTIFTGQRIRYVTEPEIDRFDPLRRSFINVNTRAEYEEVLCSDLGCRS